MASEPAEFRLEVEPLDLGPDMRAIGLELVESETREPVEGSAGADVWAALIPVLAGTEPWVLDFIAHLERIHEFCDRHAIDVRASLPGRGRSDGRLLVIQQPGSEPLRELIARFAGETFGLRVGEPLLAGDADTESGLAARGIDAYQGAWQRYLLCGVCDFENGFLTLLSERLWASEVIRRARSAFRDMSVDVTRPE